LGDKIVDQLVGKGMVKDIADLYSLKLEDVAELERMAEKSAQNLLDEIAASKKNSLARLIYALGIRMVGERTGQLLAAHFSSLDELAEAKEEQLFEVGEVGPKVAAAIAEFFSEPANKQIIKKLEKAGVRPTAEKRVLRSQKFAGKSFVFTGALANRSREEAGQLVMSHGGKSENACGDSVRGAFACRIPTSRYGRLPIGRNHRVLAGQCTTFRRRLALPRRSLDHRLSDRGHPYPRTAAPRQRRNRCQRQASPRASSRDCRLCARPSLHRNPGGSPLQRRRRNAGAHLSWRIAASCRCFSRVHISVHLARHR
jgi:hypothetical protein